MNDGGLTGEWFVVVVFLFLLCVVVSDMVFRVVAVALYILKLLLERFFSSVFRHLAFNQITYIDHSFSQLNTLQYL